MRKYKDMETLLNEVKRDMESGNFDKKYWRWAIEYFIREERDKKWQEAKNKAIDSYNQTWDYKNFKD